MISPVCVTGFWAPFKISQNLPKHSAATKAVTWFLKTPAACGDLQTSGMGTVLTWVSPAPLQYPSHCWRTHGGLQGSESSS